MENKNLAIINDNIESKFLESVSKNYPVSIQEGLKDVISIIEQEKNVTDLYPKVLSEVSISQSQFQDMCVQYEQHFTPHKKLRQAVMEMQDRLSALYSAKTGYKKSIVKIERLNLELENLQNELDKSETDYERRRWELNIADKMIDLEEAQRDNKSSMHLVKDAMLKVMQQRKLVEKYEAEVKETGLSYEESEVIYYTMYFTFEVEKQLRTGDHQIDRGTFGAILQLPENIKNKILKNISFLRKKLFEDGYPIDGDYLVKVYEDQLKPKKTGENEFEGMKIQDFINTDIINILSLKDPNS